MSYLTGKLQTSIKGLQETKLIESFSELGFSALITFRWAEAGDWEISGVLFTINLETNLNRESWSRLFALLTSLLPTSLSLSFSGLSEQEWISPVSSLGTLFLANTYLQEIDEGLSILTQFPKEEAYQEAKSLLSPALSILESAHRKFQNDGS